MHIGARLLRTIMRGRGAGDIKGPGKMHRNHRIPFFRRHAMKDLVAQNARIIHHDINAPEVIHGGLHNLLRAGPGGHAIGADF